MYLKKYSILFFIYFIFYLPLYSQLKQEDITYDSVVTFTAGDYKVTKFRQFFFGKQNRKLWAAKAQAPVFNLTKSGLEIVKKGGGRQTLNLRLRDPKTGYEYVLRSIDKTPSKAIPEEFHNTFISDIFQDQTSAENPYGAFTIPPMARAIGIYYSMPYLVYVPLDSAFGEYTNYLADKPALFEMRPDSNLVDLDNYGNPREVRSTSKMLEKLYKNHDNKIDELHFLRSRLFDMVIGDWGRHDDNWRWGEVKEGDKKIFRPIPRDRDHAYFKINGVFPDLLTRSWAFRNFSDFRPCYQDLIGLNFSAASLDRKALIGLTKDQWIEEAKYIQTHLTDEVIESAIALLPPEAYKISGVSIIETLKSRRAQLVQAAILYYEIIQKEVNVPGSDKREYFEVNRISNDSTEVLVYALSKENEKKELLFKRYFLTGQTREINLYGLDGEDVFKINGKTKKGIQIRIVGGEGEDYFEDHSYVGKGRRKTLIYDTRTGSKVVRSNETRVLLSDNPKDSVNLFFNNFNYNYNGPMIFPGYNPDDGLFLGLGVIRKTYEFRKSPFKSIQGFGVNYATQTGAFNFKYLGDFRLIFKRWHLLIDAKIYGPQFVFNYFGYGNDSKNIANINFYRTRGMEFILNPSIYKELRKHLYIGFGPDYHYYRIDSTAGRFISIPQPEVEPEVFKPNHFLGAKGYLKIINVDSLILPASGYKLNFHVTPYAQLNGEKKYVNTCADISVFYTPKFLKVVTVAQRIGGAANFGDYFFFQAPNIGGTQNLRGFRRSRFFGNQSIYSNNELRVKVFKFRSYIFNANVGLIAFYDIGRVWSNEESDTWHYGYGPGFWLQFFDKAVFSTTFGVSDEGMNIFFKYGFFF